VQEQVKEGGSEGAALNLRNLLTLRALVPSTPIAMCVLRSHKVCNGGIGLNVEVHEVCRAASAWGTSRSRDLRLPGEEQHCSDLCLVECSHRLWMPKAGDCCRRLLDLFIGKKL
jgi:hypothetical protein